MLSARQSQALIPVVATCLYCASAICPAANAQPGSTNPTLFAELDGAADARRYLELADLGIDVTLEGSIVETTLTARFRGDPEETLEGHFLLALPDGAAVTGYGLDIEGRMIDGVLAKSHKAQSAYDDIVRASIDPGVGKVSAANTFSTQVYPVYDDTGRTIRVTFAAPMDPKKGFELPLRSRSTIERISIRLKARAVSAAPVVQLPFDTPVEWQATEDGFEASLTANGVALDGLLGFAEVARSSAITLSRHSSGETFFQIKDAIGSGIPAASTPQSIRVYWDASRSRRDDLIARERQLLKRYLSFVPDAQVRIIVFNSRGAQSHGGSHSDVDRVIDGITYRGGTSFADLSSVDAVPAQVCLLFSDGIATFDTIESFEPACVMHTITSAPDADVGFLRRLARETSGTWSRLEAGREDDILERLRYRSARVIEVTDDTGSALPFVALPSSKEEWLIVGKAPSRGLVRLHLADFGAGSSQREYALPERETSFDAVGSLWALDRVLELNTRPEEAAALLALSQRYRVASSAASFVVFEDPFDYARRGIEPPTHYAPEQREEYARYKAEFDAEQAELAAERLSHVLNAWEEHKAWWGTKFNPHARRQTKRSRRRGEGPLEEVVVTGLRQSIIMKATIFLEPWDLQRSYLKALDASSRSRIERTLLEQEELHGRVPSFYLDVAEWLHRHGRTSLALDMVESALELPSANEETVAIVADRLLRYGSMQRAIWLYERLLHVADDRPQPRLALAFALAKRAGEADSDAAKRDLHRAVSLLNEIVMMPWENDYEGIEIIALTEANAIIPKLRELGVTDLVLDPRLIARLDVDIRIVVQWNTAATDIDLWIDEPNGERAIYHNPLTATGGRLSNDMTMGYGPEEYMLRRSRRGSYEIRLDAYAGDPLDPNGSTWVTVRVYRNFGRETQHEKVIELELLPDQDGERFVGNVRGR